MANHREYRCCLLSELLDISNICSYNNSQGAVSKGEGHLTNVKGANPVQLKQRPMATRAVSWALREMTKTHRDRVAVTWRKIATSWQATSCAR